jgi:hypothetical protein
MTNAELAADLVRQADGHMAERRSLLACSVALGTTKTIPAAKKALREWDGPGDVRAGAVELLDELSEGW